MKKNNSKKIVARTFIVAALALTSLVTQGCSTKIFDKVTVTPSENLEVIRVSVTFAKSVSLDLSGSFALKDYGNLFVNPFTSTTPFEVGFNLNTAIVNDQEYVRLTPTEVLPNGMPIGVGTAVVQINSPKPISPHFDAYAYVDVRNRSWLGAAAIINMDIAKKIPKDYSLRKVFLRDSNDNPTLIGAAYGPFTKADGSTDSSAGVAIFANARALLNKFSQEHIQVVVSHGEAERIERVKH